MTLEQSYPTFANGFRGYLSNLKSLLTQSLSHNMDLRDASASKKKEEERERIYSLLLDFYRQPLTRVPFVLQLWAQGSVVE